MPREVCVLLRRFPLFFLAGISLLVCLPGVALADFFVTHAEMAARMETIKTIGLLPPEIRIYELSAGGISELKEDWTALGKENVTRAMVEKFGGRLIEIRMESLDNASRTELEEIRSLYRHVALSFLNHTEGPDAFPGKKERFDYSLGPMEKLLAELKVDALLFVGGVDRISTGGRKALAALGIIGGVVFLPGGTGLSIGLADGTGSILWYRFQGSAFGGDFREPEGAVKFTEGTLSGFPGVGK